MKSLAPNTLLQNRYLIVNLIGKGGMGDVYLAVDQRLGSAVALKRTKFSDDEMLVNAFEREAKILARLRHSVLPKVSDHFIEQDNQFLVMEHISGDDLAKRLEINQKPFPLSWVLFWADQLLDALSYLHAHEPPIIHRDIKPQNLKLTDDNNIILLDFGLSKNSVGFTNVSTTAGGGSSGSTGSVVGYTPHYAPMEQIRGTGTNPRSDIYSLSATLYQLLTDVVPPDALSRADSLLSGLEDPLQPISEINPEVTKAVSDAIIKGMSVSQDQRFAAAKEMQKDLRDVYAQLQNAMGAHTVAFNMQDAGHLPADSQPLQQKLRQITTPLVDVQAPPPPPPQSGIETQIIPSELDSGVLRRDGSGGNSYNSQPQSQEPDFDATMRADSQPKNVSSQPKQSDIKTEVFSGGLGIEAIEPDLKSEAVQNEKFEAERNFSPEATVPLISFDSLAEENKSAKTDTGYDSASPDGEEFSSGAPFDRTENYRADETFSPPATTPTENRAQSEAEFSQADNFYQPAEERYHSQPETSQPIERQSAPAAAAAQNKSSGKIFAIIGGLAALLILAVGAGAIGWYLLKDSGAGNAVNSTAPSPEASVPAMTPTPEEVLVETNSDTNSVSTEDLSETNTNVEANDQQDVTKTDVTTTTTDKPKTVQTPQQNAVKPTPRQTQVVTTKAPVTADPPPQKPKPTPKKTSDTKVILQ